MKYDKNQNRLGIAILVLLLASACGCQEQTTSSDKTIISSVEPPEMDIATSSFQVTVHTENLAPEVYRNMGCSADSFAFDYDFQLLVRENGTNQEWQPLENINPNIGEQYVDGMMPTSLQSALVEGNVYDVMLRLPAGQVLIEEAAITIIGNGSKDTDNDTDSDSVDSDSDTTVDTGTDTGIDTNTDTGLDTSSDSETDTGIDTGTDTGTDTGRDTGIDTGSDTGTDTGTDTETVQALHIEAECGFGLNTGDCGGLVDGFNSETPFVGGTVPSCTSPYQIVQYMNTNAWIAFPDVNLTNIYYITLYFTSDNAWGNLDIYLDDPISNAPIGNAYTYSGSWTNWITTTVAIDGLAGIYDLYIVGGQNQDGGGNANLDWVELSATVPEVDTDPATCDATMDCFGGCWGCAVSGACRDEHQACIDNTECLAISDCVDHDCASLATDQWQACYDGCLLAHPWGQTAYQNMRSCVMCDVCTWSCAEYNACM